MLVRKRINRRHKYYTAVFQKDASGKSKFFRFFKWKRSDPRTWVNPPIGAPPVFGAWYRASCSANTKDVYGRVTKVDGTATHYGSKEETIQCLKDAFKRSCGYPEDYWGFDEDVGKWFLDFGALQVYVEVETLKPKEVKTGKVSEESFIKSCR